jgi:hypothetical protein
MNPSSRGAAFSRERSVVGHGDPEVIGFASMLDCRAALAMTAMDSFSASLTYW